MKKHELIKMAYDKYPKGTKFKQLKTSEEIESSGVFFISKGDNCFGVCDRENDNAVYSSTNKQWATIVTEKTAVKVNNEFEFNELEKHYKSLGWKMSGYSKAKYPQVKYYNSSWNGVSNGEKSIDQAEKAGYTIIDYADFSREKGLALKPASIDFKTNFGIKSTILNNEVLLDCGCGALSLTDKDIESIHSAMQSLK